MSVLKDAALSVLEEERLGGMDYCHYCTIFDGLDEIETLAERDAELAELWAELEDVAFDDDSPTKRDMVLVDSWRGFPAGTSREDIWHWFDERHSKGVAYLLYRDGVDRTGDIVRLCYLNQLCDDCESEDCAYCEDGVCRYPLVRGVKPRITEEDGCIDFTIDGME